MAANENTKFQVNFKLNDGTLINIYATDPAELERELTVLQDTSYLIRSVSASLSNGQAPSYEQAVATAQVGLGAQVISQTPAPVQQATTASGNSCPHGALVWRESKPGAPKPWKGWFCPSPKGTADQCAPKFVR